MIILLYSKYSNFSRHFMLTLSESNLKDKLPIKFLCVDNEKLRKRIIQSKQIKIHNIPCILIVQSNGVVDKYEGTDCFLWLEDMIRKIVPQQQPSHQFLQQPTVNETKKKEEEQITIESLPSTSKVTSVDDINTDDENNNDDDDLLSDVNLIRLERDNYDKQNIVQNEHKIDRNYDQKSNRKSDVKKNHLSKFVEEMQKSRELEEKNLPRPPMDSPRL